MHMESSSSQPFDLTAWSSATLGSAIGVYVDRQVNKGMQQLPASTGYGMDERGNLYQLGQANTQSVAARSNNNTLLLMLLVGFAVWELK